MKDIPSRSKRLWMRFLGGAILKTPPPEWQSDGIKDAIMIFHFCPVAGEYRYDRHHDLLSKAEGFACGGCRQEYKTQRMDLSTYPLFIYECIKEARGCRFKILAFFKYIIFGLGKKLPQDRGGKSSGELYMEGIAHLIAPFEAAMDIRRRM